MPALRAAASVVKEWAEGEYHSNGDDAPGTCTVYGVVEFRATVASDVCDGVVRDDSTVPGIDSGAKGVAIF